MNETEAVLHDGSKIVLRIEGEGRNLLLPVRSTLHDPATAETMRQWGADPELGPRLIAGLSTSFRVIAADYEAHRMEHPAAETLTPQNLAADLLAIADAVGADRFAYYGYSWLALAGLQLALRTDRLWALAMGGFPPIDGPYPAMLAVTRAAHQASSSREAEADATVNDVEVTPGDWDSAAIQTDEEQTRQFVTLYEALAEFDDAAVQAELRMPRLCFAGSEDAIEYPPRWGGVTVRIAEPLLRDGAKLESAGWDVEVLSGLDHLGAMHSDVVLPLLRGWLSRVGEARV
ncbi:hypothetical protein GCM10022381_33640 [Leifsonia kafniensis]|uniref:Alpha/beta hydrolase n=1 Tax=Leifsonia kafniensis TaxID=475957 RepID=A0ABP7KW01_9MICO